MEMANEILESEVVEDEIMADEEGEGEELKVPLCIHFCIEYI
tara:strand:- start:1769 stop:1894 length:126 start_codon:yes stop_codon:yes gene_type:complete